MGIPGYFGYVAARYPGIVVDTGILGNTHIATLDSVDGTDGLYIDYNNLIHNCARHATTGRTFAKTEDMFCEVIAHILSYTRKLVALVRPKHVLHLAVDGVPPLSKMVQQRKRRFMSSLEARVKGTISQWRPAYVTPSTKFMTQLSQALRGLKRDLHAEFQVEVVLSSWDVEGEGEHKIFADMRTRQSGWNMVVYGMDADMLMLSLLHSHQRIVVMRQHHDASMAEPLMNHFSFVVIDHLRASLAKEMRCAPDEAARDYVCMCALVGNDFLPPLSFLTVDSIPMLLRNAAGLQRRLVSSQPLDDGCLVCFDALKALIAPSSYNEDRHMATADNRYMYAKPPLPAPGTAAKEHNWTYLPLIHKHGDVIKPREPGWRLRYGQHLLGGITNLSTATESYLEGIEWIMRYYMNNSAADISWMYTFSYSPPIQNLYVRLVDTPTLRKGWEGKHLLPFKITPGLQLVAVLPPSEHALLPRRVQSIMTRIECGCVHMFPVHFKVNTYLKWKSWDCQPVLPALDINLIRKAVETK